MKFECRQDIHFVTGKKVDLFTLDGQQVLSQADFSFQQGEVYRVLGNMGDCSEFLKMLGFINVDSRGEIFINQDNTSEMSFDEFAKYRLNIGYTFDHGGLLNNKTIRENIILPLHYHNELSMDEASNKVDELLDYFDMGEFSDKRPAHTPGYVRKLACVIRSLALKPQVLAMDGPTTAIDKIRANKLVDYIAKKKQAGEIKLLLFSSTYDTGFESWGAKNINIKQGKVTFEDIQEVAA